MTNNDELALKLKAAAEKASGGEWVRESGEGWEAICSDDDQVNGGFVICSFQGNDDESNRKFVQRASPANILALLAERDADKKRIAELEARTVSVKLPPKVDSSNLPFAAQSWNSCIDEVTKRLAATGVNVEFE